MKLGAAILIVVAATVLGGCGGDERASWDGPPRPFPTDGNLPTDGFAAYLDAVDEPWEQSLLGVATAYVQPLIGAAGDLHAAFPPTEPEGNGTVVVTLGRLFDDSVRELRFVLTFDPLEDDAFRPLEARWQQRCHPGRGHQEWSTGVCV